METLITNDSVRLAYRVDGESGAPPLLFANSLGTDLRMWDPQAMLLSSGYRVVRYDTRGHGRSDAPPGPYTIERLAMDALELLDQLSVERAHVCGLSLGGVTALWLAIHHPERLRSAVFANTAARIGTAESWAARIEAVQAGGMSAIRETVLGLFFSPAFHNTHPEVVAATGETLAATDPGGYIAACAALRDTDLRPAVVAIRVPALILCGTLDESTPPLQSEELHEAIGGSTLLILDNAAHLANLEQAEAFNAAMLRFLAEHD